MGLTFKKLKDIVAEDKMSAAQKKKREEIAQAIHKEHPDMPMDKKMRIATSTAMKCCESDIQDIDEASNYDLVVNYYRSIGLDPYKLRGASGKVIRDKIKNSPGFHAYVKTHTAGDMQYASYSATENLDALEEGKNNGVSAKQLHHELTNSGFKLLKSQGTNHDLYAHSEIKHPKIAVPRHKGDLSPGVVGSVRSDIKKYTDPNYISEMTSDSLVSKIIEAFKKSKAPSEEIIVYSDGSGSKSKKSEDQDDSDDNTDNGGDQPSITNDSR